MTDDLEMQARELVARLREQERYPVEEHWHIDLVLAFARRLVAGALREAPEAGVRAFHDAFGIPLGASWTKPERRALRRRLITEEYNEYLDAEAANDARTTLGALVDLVYVIVGAALEYGMDFTGAFAAVQAANMALTPEGWRPADLTPFALAAEAEPGKQTPTDRLAQAKAAFATAAMRATAHEGAVRVKGDDWSRLCSFLAPDAEPGAQS